jgi:hypothetical protein
MRLGWTL